MGDRGDKIIARFNYWKNLRISAFNERFNPEYWEKIFEFDAPVTREKLILESHERKKLLSDWTLRSKIAFESTNINNIPYEVRDVIKKCFRELKLDYDDPADWAKIVIIFSHVFFTEPEESGRPAFWSGEVYSTLMREFFQIRHSRPNLSENSILNIIAKKEPFSARSLSLSAMKKAWHQAKSLDHNEWLSNLIIMFELDLMESDYGRALKLIWREKSVFLDTEYDESAAIRGLILKKFLKDWRLGTVDGYALLLAANE